MFGTGASKGIGFELAVGLARAGASVVANYNSDERGALAVVEQIVSSGGRAIAVGADVASVAGCRELVDRAVREFGRLDIACCHAGITSWGKFLDFTEEAFDAVGNTNPKGANLTARAAARQLLTQAPAGPS